MGEVEALIAPAFVGLMLMTLLVASSYDCCDQLECQDGLGTKFSKF